MLKFALKDLQTVGDTQGADTAEACDSNLKWLQQHQVYLTDHFC